jgi:hypothetical protein
LSFESHHKLLDCFLLVQRSDLVGNPPVAIVPPDALDNSGRRGSRRKSQGFRQFWSKHGARRFVIRDATKRVVQYSIAFFSQYSHRAATEDLVNEGANAFASNRSLILGPTLRVQVAAVHQRPIGLGTAPRLGHVADRIGRQIVNDPGPGSTSFGFGLSLHSRRSD